MQHKRVTTIKNVQKVLAKRKVNAKKQWSNYKIVLSSIIISGLIIFTAILSQWSNITGEIEIHTANPVMVKLAHQAGMNFKGEVLFLRTKPQIDSDSQFQNDCSTTAINNTGYSEVGCYVPNSNRIYILRMPQSLYDEEVTTAAYEMLHPVYISLYQSDGKNLNQAIEANFSAVSTNSGLSSCTDDMSGQVTSFAKSEPGARDEELFSLLGTECDNLSPSLARYYSPYFSNLAVDVTDNSQIDGLFQGDENQLTQLNNTMNQLNNKINTDYTDTESWNGVDETQFNYDYNIYNSDINTYNNDVAQFNNLLDTTNTLITAINGGQPINQAQTQTAQ